MTAPANVVVIVEEHERGCSLEPCTCTPVDTCPECKRTDRVESAEGFDRLAGQRACRWWCERCNLAFSEIEDE